MISEIKLKNIVNVIRLNNGYILLLKKFSLTAFTRQICQQLTSLTIPASALARNHSFNMDQAIKP